MMRQADWYFDFVSPFAYLQFEAFDRFPDDLAISLKPVLFAGFLGHWEHKGPAEIPAKRRQTYRYCHWLAGMRGIPYKMPQRGPRPRKPGRARRLPRDRGSRGASRRPGGQAATARQHRGSDRTRRLRCADFRGRRGALLGRGLDRDDGRLPRRFGAVPERRVRTARQPAGRGRAQAKPPVAANQRRGRIFKFMAAPLHAPGAACRSI